jgi:RecA/RadA recombinase
MTAKEVLLAKRPKQTLEGAVSSGSTLLNLACTERPDVAFLKGGYYYLVGDSQSGKTFLTLTCFAEACRNKAFAKYRLIFDDVEGGALMDIAHYFGKEVAARMEAPSRRKGQPIFSDTIESFYYHLSDLLDEGRPFIYVLDSQDALSSDAAAKKFRKQRKAAKDEGEAAGSYGDGKAKYHSEHIREVLSRLRRSGSILIVIGQTRDNLGMSFEPKTRSGGRALRFYANLEIWTSVVGKLRKLVHGDKRTIGARCLAEIKKNRVTGKVGKDRAVEIPIYYDLGIDDVGSCVDFLITNKHWKRAKKEEGSEEDSRKAVFDAKEMLITGTRSAIIARIEEDGMEEKLREITAQIWNQIEEECLPNRKRRYE